jgi:hypothetical protein
MLYLPSGGTNYNYNISLVQKKSVEFRVDDFSHNCLVMKV